MKYCIEVKADSNDGDYVTTISVIEEEVLDRLKTLFEAIKNCEEQNNWPTSEYSDGSPHDLYPQFTVPMEPPLKEWDETCSLLELFEETCEPYGEYGVHTIVSVYVYPAVEKERLV